MKKSLVIFSLIFAITSCSDYKTHGKFISEHKDAWIDGYGPGGKPTYAIIDRDSEADAGLLFCRANVKDDGGAAPVCYYPKFK